MSKNFSSDVRRMAYQRAGARCQICGDDDFLLYNHIHSKKLKLKYARAGSRPDKAYDQGHLRSIDNVIMLCINCSYEINSKQGLKDFSVKYLESLNENPHRCTALIPQGTEWIRCSHRKADNSAYRCWDHLAGKEDLR